MQNIFINNTWQAGDSAEEIISVNPANGEAIWQANAASTEQAQQAVQAARSAFDFWSSLTIEQRIGHLEKFQELLTTAKDDIARAISLDNGKPLWEAKTEVAAMLAKFQISVKAYNDRTGITNQALPALSSTQQIIHRPHGVMAILGPFNFPGHLAHGHMIPALLAGNTIVYKPSDLTPYTAHEIFKLWQQAELPAGVVNLVQGKVETSKALLASNIDGVLFTGSYATGKLIHQQFAGRPEILLALEMGGNNSLIVDSVNNINAAVYNILQSAFITAGQRCTCARRLLLPRATQADALLQQLITATKNITVAAWDAEPQPFIGPVITAKQVANLLAAQDNLQAIGGESLLSMQFLQADTGFISPGIMDVTNINTQNKLPDEELFGPFLQIIRYDNLDEAIKIANHTQYGLAAGVLSDDQAVVDKCFAGLRAGIINCNRPTTGAASSAPFGGIGRSGNHRPSAYYAADYCAYPVASMFADKNVLPDELLPGVNIKS